MLPLTAFIPITMMFFRKRWFWLLLTAIAVAALIGYRTFAQSAGAPGFRTVAIERGDITAAVSATGTLNPVVSVQVGSQVSGQLKEVLADFNTEVKKGQLIARIDPQTFEYRVRQAQADVDAARSLVLTQEANIAVQRAEVSRFDVQLADARIDLERKQSLVKQGFISSAELDKARAALNALVEQLKSAQAQVRVAEANAANAAAVVRQREAALAQARIDLERTAIRAPVSGIVIKRSVEQGQTVAASLQAPELFIIAENLADMRVETSIDEAEIGRVKPGQQATFTVDAFPGRTFEGTVKQIRKAAINVSNVITYMAEVNAPNPDNMLLPGMTASVRIVTERRSDVLKAPNAALRYRPPADASGKDAGARMRRAANTEKAGDAGQRGKVYILDERGEAQAVPVRVGVTDGTTSELIAPELQAGMDIIIGNAQSAGATRGASQGRPSGPRMF